MQEIHVCNKKITQPDKIEISVVKKSSGIPGNDKHKSRYNNRKYLSISVKKQIIL
jgi:hypothetical protein